MASCSALYRRRDRDSDSDGIPDACDNCPCTPNPGDDDTDGDGNGDQCDSTTTVPAPPPGTPGDEDEDGVLNDTDNCLCEYNPDQADEDENGSGDACAQCPIQLVELPIYGIGRVGVSRPKDIFINGAANSGPVYSRYLGEKFYELADHLGNVRMVVSDIKRSIVTGGVPSKFFADVRQYTNAYPYGMAQPGRWWDSSLTFNWQPQEIVPASNGVQALPEMTAATVSAAPPTQSHRPRLMQTRRVERVAATLRG